MPHVSHPELGKPVGCLPSGASLRDRRGGGGLGFGQPTPYTGG